LNIRRGFLKGAGVISAREKKGPEAIEEEEGNGKKNPYIWSDFGNGARTTEGGTGSPV